MRKVTISPMSFRLIVTVAFALACLRPVAACADSPTVLKIGTVMPDGSTWAREAHVFMNAVEEGTNGRLKVKIYFGGVAGDEEEQLSRIGRGQLDGTIAGMLCERVAPSMRLVRLPGLFQSRDEAASIMSALFSEFESEAAKAGYVISATAGLGTDVYFTKQPVHSMAELRRVKLWRWSADEVGIATSRAMGLTVVPMEINEAAHSLDSHKIDGMIAIPQAALAWQWSARAPYLTDLRGSYLWGCMLIASSSFNRLAPEYRAVFRSAAAQFSARIEIVGRTQDQQLVSGRLRERWATPVPVPAAFRAEFFAVAQSVREQLGERFVSRTLLDRVLRMLADYRAEHAN